MDAADTADTADTRAAVKADTEKLAVETAELVRRESEIQSENKREALHGARVLHTFCFLLPDNMCFIFIR